MKYIKWFLLSSFLILFLGICDVVNALELKSGAMGPNDISGYGQIQNGFFLTSPFSLNNHQTFNFNVNIPIEKYDYFTTHIYFTYTNTIQSTTSGTETITGNINECTYWNLKEMTYADGTKSNYYVCEQYTSSGSQPITGNTYTTFNNKVGLQVDILLDGTTWSVCEMKSEVDGSTSLKCPLSSTNNNITRFRFRYTNLDNITGTGILGIANVYDLIKDPINSMIDKQDETNNQLQDMNENITSTDISGASQDQNNLVNNSAFKDSTGLSGIITAPLSMISSLTNQCQPIQLTLPYLKDTNVSIPCMGNFLQSKIPTLFTLIKVFVNGFICYLIGLDLFKIVKNARDPDNDRIEVLDL